MKNKGIVIFLIILALVIVAVMVGDWYSKRPDRMEANKFEFSVDEFKNVPDELIHYRESKNFRLGFNRPAGLTIFNDEIYAVGDSSLKIIDLSGQLRSEIYLNDAPKTAEADSNNIFIAFRNRVEVFNPEGTKTAGWNFDENSVITSMAATPEFVYFADAGRRKVIKMNRTGEKLMEFDGKADQDDLHGFIIPSPYFDLDINAFGDLWVVNPGLHTLENYTPDGNLREHWQASGAATENFSGCCNPAHFCFLPDGSFVTSEKGLVRIKVYKPSGEFDGVVAPPTKFDDKIEGQAPDIAVDSQGNIYALDFDRNVLRVFEKKL